MLTGEPRVSVIVPTFNRLVFLRPALDSVFAQSDPDWELLIADDGSDGETLSYLRSLADPRVTVLTLSHTGNPSQVRNAAIARARGRYVAFLDSDDLWYPHKLALQVAALAAAPDCRWSYTAIDKIDAEGKILPHSALGPRPGGWIFPSLLRLDIGIAMPTVMAQTRLLREIGAFDETQAFGEFHDLCLRLALRAPVVSVDPALTAVRTHTAHYSADREADQAGWLRLYAKMARLAPDPALRSLCRKLRAERSVRLAATQASKARWNSAAFTLLRSARYAWRHPGWWRGIVRGAWRALVR